MTNDLELAFHEAMQNVYHLALSECKYKAARFLQIVENQGGMSAAKQLLNSQNHPEGLTRLWKEGRLDLSMENLVLQEKWASLFTQEELEVARSRLKSLNFEPSD